MAATHTPNLNLNKPDRQDLVSVIHDINDNMDKIDEEAGMVDDGIAIVIDGNTAPRAISSGQYLLIKNHSTLATGGYHATANIANGESVTSSNVAVDSDGIANALNSKISYIHPTILSNINDVVSLLTNETNNYYLTFRATASLMNTICGINYSAVVTAFASGSGSNWFEYVAVNSDGKLIVGAYNMSTGEKIVTDYDKTNGTITPATGYTASQLSYYRSGNVVQINIRGLVPSASSSGWTTIASLPSGLECNTERTDFLVWNEEGHTVAEGRIYNGNLQIYGPVASNTYYGGVTYIPN